MITWFSTSFWLFLFLLFLAGEAVTVGLTSIWFALGALASLIVCSLKANLYIQIITFTFVSFTSLVFLRPILQMSLEQKKQPTNAERLIGEGAIVTTDIDNIHNAGTVKVCGESWSAISADGAPLPIHTLVKVLEIKGVKLIVEKLQIENN